VGEKSRSLPYGFYRAFVIKHTDAKNDAGVVVCGPTARAVSALRGYVRTIAAESGHPSVCRSMLARSLAPRLRTQDAAGLLMMLFLPIRSVEW
jgi:hypothetical protein